MLDVEADGARTLAGYFLVVAVGGVLLNGVGDTVVFVAAMALLAVLIGLGRGSFEPGAAGDSIWVVGVYLLASFGVTAFIAGGGDAFFMTAMLGLVVLFLWE